MALRPVESALIHGMGPILWVTVSLLSTLLYLNSFLPFLRQQSANHWNPLWQSIITSWNNMPLTFIVQKGQNKTDFFSVQTCVKCNYNAAHKDVAM